MPEQGGTPRDGGFVAGRNVPPYMPCAGPYLFTVCVQLDQFKQWGRDRVRRWAREDVGLDTEDVQALWDAKVTGRRLLRAVAMDPERRRERIKDWGVAPGPGGDVLDEVDNIRGGGHAG